MRYIDLTKLEFPPGWIVRAQNASKFVKALPKTKRPKAINNRSGVWSALKPKLKKLSSNKCWYCESKEIRADKAVDHYRPKGAVYECSTHRGYWWLAFDWENFRYSCQYCNEYRIDEATGKGGGKSTHFPLCNERNRVSTPGPTTGEKPKLLDPTVKSDTRLLSFYADGMARPRDKNKRLQTYQRAKKSIELYNLNQSDLQDLRRAIFHRVAENVVDGDAFYLDHLAGIASGTRGFKKIVKEFSEMIDEQTSYSMAARAALRAYKKRPWINDILNSKKI